MTAVSPFVVRSALHSKASTSVFPFELAWSLAAESLASLPQNRLFMQDSESHVGAIDEHKSESDDEPTYQAIS